MKLIIAGATGFVGIETTIQALSNSKLTSVVALTRRPLELPAGIDTTKLSNAVVPDFDRYSDEAKKQLADADACIWTMAVTPLKAKGMDPELVKHICHNHTFTGLDVIVETRTGKSTPLRFLYVSGIAVRRDPKDIPSFVPEDMRHQVIMRGAVENELLAYAAKRPGELEVSVARPGFISSAERVQPQTGRGAGMPAVAVGEIAACMIDQVMNGFEKDPLLNEDLVRIGKQVLQKQG